MRHVPQNKAQATPDHTATIKALAALRGLSVSGYLRLLGMEHLIEEMAGSESEALYTPQKK